MSRAIHYSSFDEMEKDALQGSFCIEPRQTAGLFEFRYICPCGCGIIGRLLIGENHKPSGDRPSWNWNGSTTEPTLTPSVHHVDHWHGYLRAGHWEAV